MIEKNIEILISCALYFGIKLNCSLSHADASLCHWLSSFAVLGSHYTIRIC